MAPVPFLSNKAKASLYSVQSHEFAAVSQPPSGQPTGIIALLTLRQLRGAVALNGLTMTRDWVLGGFVQGCGRSADGCSPKGYLFDGVQFFSHTR